MNGHPLRTFTHPSNFTFLDRHLTVMKALSACLPGTGPFALLDIGSGVIEPFVFGEVVEKWSRGMVRHVTAIDSDPRVCNILGRLTSGDSVPMEQIIEISTNVFNDGSSELNRDLSGLRLQRSIKRLGNSRLNVESWFPDSLRRFRPQNRFQVIPMQIGIKEFVEGPHHGMYDAAILGALLVNIRKTTADEELVDILCKLHGALSNDAILCITTTPKGFLASPSDFDLVEKSGFHLLCAFPEKIVAPKNGLSGYVGDIAAFFNKEAKLENPDAKEVIRTLFVNLRAHPQVRSVAIHGGDRASGYPCDEQWLPVGWFPVPETGTQFNFDVSAMKPADEIVFDLL